MENQVLEKMFESKKSGICILYGKAGTGKTTIIRKKIGNNSLYFRSDLQHDMIQLPRYVNVYNTAFPNHKIINNKDWEIFFETILKNPTPDIKRVIAFDDFPNLVKSNRSVLPILETAWKKTGSKNNVLLILSGGSLPEIKFVSERVHDFGDSFDIQDAKVEPLNFFEFRKLFPNIDTETAVAFYTVTGGIPKYYTLLDPTKDVFYNIEHNLLDPKNISYLDPRIMLNYDFHDPTTYFSIMQILALHECKIGVIAEHLGLRTHNLTSFLDRLRELDLIERILPATDEDPSKSRKGKYRITEFFYLFWFRYVYANQDYLHQGNIKAIIAQFKADYNFMMKRTVLEIIKSMFVIKEYPFVITNISSWWEKEKGLDLVALGEREILFGSAFWGDEEIGTNELYSLIQESHFVPAPRRIRIDNYVMFSKAGFTKEAEKDIKKKRKITLLTLDDLK
jgi:uncharacterized protein